MISMRYHIISLAAVFLALAVGVILGATKVGSPLLNSITGERDTVTQERDQLKVANESLQRQAEAGDGIADAVSEVAVRQLLNGDKVVLVTTADANPADRDAVKNLLVKAGATVSTEIDLTDAFTDPARAEELRGLITSNIPAGKSLPVVEKVGSQAGGLLSLLFLADASGNAQAKADEISAGVGAFEAAGYLAVSDAPAAGSLVLIVTGGANTGGSEADRAAVVSDMAAQLKVSAAGVVIAGAAGSEGETGAVGLIRSDPAASSAVSTVDDVDSGTGRLAAVLALAEQKFKSSGQYGTGANAGAAMPTLRT